MRERELLVRSRRLRARRKKEWGRVEAAESNQIWQSDMTKIWAGPAVGWAYLVCVIDCCTREIVGWNLSHRCRTEDALTAIEQAVLARLPEGSREANVTLTIDNGTQFTSSRFIETLNRLSNTHRGTAYHQPEGNSYIERFQRSSLPAVSFFKHRHFRSSGKTVLFSFSSPLCTTCAGEQFIRPARKSMLCFTCV